MALFIRWGEEVPARPRPEIADQIPGQQNAVRERVRIWKMGCWRMEGVGVGEVAVAVVRSSEFEIMKACFEVGEFELDDSLEKVEIVKSSSFEEGGEIEGVDMLTE
jgi:hypothetical protein